MYTNWVLNKYYFKDLSKGTNKLLKTSQTKKFETNSRKYIQFEIN